MFNFCTFATTVHPLDLSLYWAESQIPKNILKHFTLEKLISVRDNEKMTKVLYIILEPSIFSIKRIYP
jgi:hypothetical protein